MKSIHSYFPSIIPKLKRIDGMVKTNIYAIKYPSMDEKSKLIKDKTNPIPA